MLINFVKKVAGVGGREELKKRRGKPRKGRRKKERGEWRKLEKMMGNWKTVVHLA